MLREPTVFVLGAGAGVDVGMLTGDMLINELRSKLDVYFGQGGELQRGSGEVWQGIRIAGARKQINTSDLLLASRAISQGISYVRSIDSYIHTHRHDENIKICGKVGIIHTILAYEKRSHLFIDETTGADVFRGLDQVHKSWLADFMYLLSAGVGAMDGLDDIFKNLTIINFNYDRCIEQFLFRALRDLFRISRERAAELMKRATIFHPYGKVAPLPWQDDNGLSFGGDPYGNQIDLAALSENIRTFNEEVENNASLAVMLKRLSEARRVVFLGFHFHQQNMELLKSSSPKKSTLGIEVFLTTLGRSGTDQTQIQSRVNDVFSPLFSAVGQYAMGADCKALLKEYSSAWL